MNSYAQPRPHLAFVVTAACSLGFLNGQLEYLRSHGFDVSVISSAGPEQEAVRKEGAEVFTIPINREISLTKDALAAWRLWRVMRRIRPDLTIVGTPKAGMLGGLASLLAGVPRRVYVLHGLRLETTIGWKRALLMYCEKISCGCAHSVRCVSRSLKERAIELGLVAADRCIVVGAGSSNGLDIERWRYTRQAKTDALKMRDRLGIPRVAPLIGFVGRFTQDKGIAELCEAFGRLRTIYPDLRLLLVGDFEEGDPIPLALRARIEDDPAIIRTGFIADVAPCYWAMDILGLPTYREGLPGASLEAQAASTPVVTTNATGAMDSVLDGVTGFRVPVGDIDSLTSALDRLLSDRELRDRMGKAGCTWVREHFERKTVWKNLLASDLAILASNSSGSNQRIRKMGKLILDRFLAALLLAVSSPLWLVAAIAIRCSLGSPVFLFQECSGRDRRPFTLYKFRTMLDARDMDGALLEDSVRLMPIGRLLQSLSIDELPQLWNVLRGEMSLVGPRPLLMRYLDRYTPEQMRRHEVLPGITGWAQVNGRNAISWEEKFGLDVWYVDHWSLLLDVRILAQTAFNIVSRHGISSQNHATMLEFFGLDNESAAER